MLRENSNLRFVNVRIAFRHISIAREAGTKPKQQENNKTRITDTFYSSEVKVN